MSSWSYTKGANRTNKGRWCPTLRFGKGHDYDHVKKKPDPPGRCSDEIAYDKQQKAIQTVCAKVRLEHPKWTDEKILKTATDWVKSRTGQLLPDPRQKRSGHNPATEHNIRVMKLASKLYKLMLKQPDFSGIAKDELWKMAVEEVKHQLNGEK